MPRTRKTVVILISGKAGCGKTTVAEMLEQKLLDIPSMSVFRYGFADPIKFMCKAYAGWDGKKDDRGRKLLQQQGQIYRDYDSDIWVKHFLNQLDRKAGILPYNFAVIHDWRFPNELSYLRRNSLLDIVTVRVFGRGGLNGEAALDVSENSLPEVSAEHLKLPNWIEDEKDTIQIWYDFQIKNTDEIEILGEKVDTILAELEKQYIVE